MKIVSRRDTREKIVVSLDELTVKRIMNMDGEEQESAPHPKQELFIELDQKAEKFDILRREEA